MSKKPLALIFKRPGWFAVFLGSPTLQVLFNGLGKGEETGQKKEEEAEAAAAILLAELSFSVVLWSTDDQPSRGQQVGLSTCMEHA